MPSGKVGDGRSEGIHDSHSIEVHPVLQILREDHFAARDMSGRHDERVPEREAEEVLDRPGDLEPSTSTAAGSHAERSWTSARAASLGSPGRSLRLTVT